MTVWHRIKSKKEYIIATERISALLDINRSESEHNELLLLSFLIEEYENVYYPLPDSPPNEIIQFALEMKGLKQKDLVPIFGSKGNVSKIINGSRKLQSEKIRELSSFLGIPLSSLIPEQNIKTAQVVHLAKIAKVKSKK